MTLERLRGVRCAGETERGRRARPLFKSIHENLTNSMLRPQNSISSRHTDVTRPHHPSRSRCATRESEGASDSRLPGLPVRSRAIAYERRGQMARPRVELARARAVRRLRDLLVQLADLMRARVALGVEALQVRERALLDCGEGRAEGARGRTARQSAHGTARGSEEGRHGRGAGRGGELRRSASTARAARGRAG